MIHLYSDRSLPGMFFALIVVAPFATLALPLQAEMRTWTDKSGKHKIEAEFIEVKDGNVHLKKSDGSVIEVPLTKLCKDDQILLRKIAQQRREAKSVPEQNSVGSIEDEFRGRIRRGESFDIQRRVVGENGIHTESFSFNFGNKGKGVPHGRTPTRRDESQHDGVWTDITGQHKIEARFLSLEDSKVQLRRKDGKVIKLPIEKLSEPDQKRARTLADSMTNLVAAPNPFGDESLDSASNSANAKRQPGEYYRGDIVEVLDFHDQWKRGVVVKMDDDTMSVLYDGDDRTDTVWLDHEMDEVRLLKANPNGANYSVSGTRLSKVDISGVRLISAELAPTTDFQPDEAKVSQSTEFRGFRLDLGMTSIFQELLDLSFLPHSDKLIATMGDNHPRREKKRNSWLNFFDLSSGSRSQQYQLDKMVSAASVSPSGSRLATVEAGDHSGDAKTVDIWDLESGSAKRLSSWNPHSKEFFKEIKALQWIDDQRLITTNFKNLLIWDVDQKKLLFKIEGGGDDRFCLSHNHRQLIVATQKEIIVIGLATGETAVRVEPQETRHYRKLALCPSGELLAASHSSGGQIDLINLETGTIFDTLNLQSEANENIGFFWPDNQHILIGGKDLVHVASKTTVWEYQHQASKIAYSNGVCWFLLFQNTPQEKFLLPLQLPQPEVAEVDESQLALRPGDVVSLEMQLAFNMAAGNRSIYEETREKLTKDLEEAGFFVSDGAPNTLVARTEQGETKQVRYRYFGDFRSEGETVNVTPRIYQLELRQGNQTVWQRKQVQSPSFHINLEQDESVQAAIKRLMQPSAGYFGIGIPSRILKPDLAKSRHSRITPAGLQ